MFRKTELLLRPPRPLTVRKLISPPGRSDQPPIVSPRLPTCPCPCPCQPFLSEPHTSTIRAPCRQPPHAIIPFSLFYPAPFAMLATPFLTETLSFSLRLIRPFAASNALPPPIAIGLPCASPCNASPIAHNIAAVPLPACLQTIVTAAKFQKWQGHWQLGVHRQAFIALSGSRMARRIGLQRSGCPALRRLPCLLASSWRGRVAAPCLSAQQALPREAGAGEGREAAGRRRAGRRQRRLRQIHLLKGRAGRRRL